MGLPASPPVSTDESEVENDSPPLRSKSISQPVQYQLPVQIPSVSYQQPVIRIDEYTMQLHFTPFYFRKWKTKFNLILVLFFTELLDAMAINEISDDNNQSIDDGIF